MGGLGLAHYKSGIHKKITCFFDIEIFCNARKITMHITNSTCQQSHNKILTLSQL